MCTSKTQIVKGVLYMDMNKFLGVGLVNALGLWFLFVILTAGAKVISVKYPIAGISEVIQSV